MTKLATRPSLADKDEAIMAMIAHGGSLRAAQRALEAQGKPRALSTLHDWRHSDRYEELAVKVRPQIEAGLITRGLETVALAFDATHQAIELERQRIESDEVKDAAASAKNLATAAGIFTEKTLLLQGKPTHITDHRQPDDLLSGLAAKGIKLTVDSTAQDVTGPTPEGTAGSERRSSDAAGA